MKIRYLTTLALLSAGLAASASEPILKYASPIKDLHVKSTVVSSDMAVLKKISTEFAQSYRFAGSEMFYKEPSKIKLISKAGIIDVTYVINGNQKTLKAGLIRKRWDITVNPGQRQTANAVGLVTPSWVNLVDVTSKGISKINGRTAAVFEAHYRAEPKGAYFIVFLDTERKIILRQEQYHGDGRPKLTIQFMDPVKQKGVWVPTKTEVLNAEGNRGAVTRMQILSLNTGLSEDIFAL